MDFLQLTLKKSKQNKLVRDSAYKKEKNFKIAKKEIIKCYHEIFKCASQKEARKACEKFYYVFMEKTAFLDYLRKNYYKRSNDTYEKNKNAVWAEDKMQELMKYKEDVDKVIDEIGWK